MTHIIEVEETVKVRHQIIIDVASEGQIEDALDSVEGCRIYDIGDYVDAIADVVPVVGFNESYIMETESIEYFDDYMCEDDD